MGGGERGVQQRGGREEGGVVVGLGELNELVKLMCGGLVVPLSL